MNISCKIGSSVKRDQGSFISPVDIEENNERRETFGRVGVDSKVLSVYV